MDSNTLTALNSQFDQADREVAAKQAAGYYPLSRNRLIEELKTNPELRAAVREVLIEETA